MLPEKARRDVGDGFLHSVLAGESGLTGLWAYSDADGGGATLYTDALTYTVVEQ